MTSESELRSFFLLLLKGFKALIPDLVDIVSISPNLSPGTERSDLYTTFKPGGCCRHCWGRHASSVELLRHYSGHGFILFRGPVPMMSGRSG